MAAILLGAYSLAWGGGYLLSGVGDRARAMGGAFTGLADDWSATFYNPAGGAFISGSEIYLGGAATTPRLNYEPQLTLGGWNVNNMPSGQFNNIDKTYMLPQLGGYAKLPSAWSTNIGVAVYTRADNNLSWKLFKPLYRTGGTFTTPDTESDVNVWTVQPTIAIQPVPERFALGAALVVNYSEIRQQRVQFVDDPGDPFGLPPFPLGLAMVDGTLQGDGYGLGYNLGALAHYEQWSIGLSFRSEIVHKLEGTSTMRLWTQVVDGRGEQTDPLLEQDLLNGVIHEGTQSVEFEMTTPPQLTFGLAFRAHDQLRFTSDLTWTWYSEVPGLIVTENDWVQFKLGDPQDLFTTVDVRASEPAQWKDQYRIAVGTEWDASETLQLRGGFFYEPSAIEAVSQTPLYADVGDKLSPSVGLAINVGRYTFGYSYGIVFYEDRRVDDWTATSLPGKYGGVQHESFFSLRYRW